VRRWALVLLALLAVACSGSKPAAAPPPPPVTEESTTTAPTTSTTAKPAPTTTGVPRTTTTVSVALGPGSASLAGTVSGPQGPVDGATVRVERLVGKAVATADVTTSGGGSWSMPSILGGSYRVRAFKVPDLGQSQTEAFFLAAAERKVIDFKLAAAGGDRITAVINPNPPRVDQPAILTITLGVGRVDDQGRPALTPRPGVALSVATGPGQVLESSPQAVTDANGAASFRIRCVVEGPSQVALTIGPGVTQVNLPPCAAAGAGGTPTTRSG
jgi:hypothetical protein